MSPVAIAVAVILRAGKVLVARRSSGSVLGGLWEFPGGKIEAGESAAQAAVRECREELGCEARALRDLGSVEHPYDDFGVRLHAVLCELPPNEEPRPLASDALQWVTLEELAALPIPEPNHELIAMITAALRQ